MLKWTGDFSVPRFRAKLANKYLLHPDVEPGYEEVYRPDLGDTTIISKDRRADATWGSATFLSTQRTAAPAAAAAEASPSATWRTTLANSGRMDMTRSSPSLLGTGRTTLMPGWASKTDSFMLAKRSISVPSIGCCRTEVMPAALQIPPSDVDGPRLKRVHQQAMSSSMSSLQAAPTSPSAEDRKEIEKEKASEAASKKLWAAAHGGEYVIKEQLTLYGTDQLSKTPVSGMLKALKQGAKLDWQCDEWDGATLLIKAVRTNALELVMYLLAKGADPLIADKSGRTILHWAALEGHLQILEYLLTTVPNLNVDKADGGGDNPIHLAAYNGHLPVVRMLVRAQADTLAQNAGGFVPQELAEARRMWHVVTYLLDFRAQEKDKATALPRPGDRKPLPGSPEEQQVELRIQDLLRSCDTARAAKIRAELKDKPKPKKKAAAPKKGK
mmetsp:Transcript_48255/g.112913  ORF Transcript_48255/g.112913 Transcript_48255/m.112913 type:complete len:442 (-) Transcript_48255:220-1545(-)